MTNRPDKEEFTEKMHSELSVDEETDLKHRVFSALREFRKNLFPREQTLKSYNVTEADIAKYEQEWIKLLG